MIDVIIPAYNAHKTIGRTLTSIAMQINRPLLKVYVVNDGSKEDYKDIINNYKDVINITEIRIKNSGPGAARQVGLEASNSEYVVFIDSDDTLYNEFAITNLFNEILDADMSQGYFLEKKNGMDNVLEPQYCYSHGKMYRRSVIEKYNIRFIETKREYGDPYEDTTFNELYMLCCDKIGTTNEIVYVYQDNQNSITRRDIDVAINLRNFVDAMTWLAEELDKREITKLRDVAWHFCIISMHAYFKYSTLEENEENNFVFEKMTRIKQTYNRYIEYLPYDEQLAIYKIFNEPVIPKLSFYDFMNKIKD